MIANPSIESIQNTKENLDTLNNVIQRAQIGATIGSLGTAAGLNSYIYNNVMDDEERKRVENASASYRKLSPIKRGREIATGMLWSNPETKALKNSYLEPARDNGYLPNVAVTIGGISGAGIAGSLALKNIKKGNSFSYMSKASAEFSILPDLVNIVNPASITKGISNLMNNYDTVQDTADPILHKGVKYGRRGWDYYKKSKPIISSLKDSRDALIPSAIAMVKTAPSALRNTNYRLTAI